MKIFRISNFLSNHKKPSIKALCLFTEVFYLHTSIQRKNADSKKHQKKRELIWTKQIKVIFFSEILAWFIQVILQLYKDWMISYQKMFGFRCAPGFTWWHLKSPLRSRSRESPTFWNSLGHYGVSWYWSKCFWTKVISVTDIVWTIWPRILRWAALDEYQLFFVLSSYGSISSRFVMKLKFLDTTCTLLYTTTVF